MAYFKVGEAYLVVIKDFLPVCQVFVLTLDIVVRNRTECYTVTMMVGCGTESSTVTHQPLFLEIVRLSHERLGQAYGTWQQQQQQIYL